MTWFTKAPPTDVSPAPSSVSSDNNVCATVAVLFLSAVLIQPTSRVTLLTDARTRGHEVSRVVFTPDEAPSPEWTKDSNVQAVYFHILSSAVSCCTRRLRGRSMWWREQEHVWEGPSNLLLPRGSAHSGRDFAVLFSFVHGDGSRKTSRELTWCNFSSALAPGSVRPSARAREFFSSITRSEIRCLALGHQVSHQVSIPLRLRRCSCRNFIEIFCPIGIQTRKLLFQKGNK